LFWDDEQLKMIDQMNGIDQTTNRLKNYLKNCLMTRARGGGV
jgi:hypothetical protein